jgi:hypothetical protein
MRYVKTVSLAAMAIAAVMAFAAAGSASANTVLCEHEEGKSAPAICETPYAGGTAIEGKSTKTVLESSLGTVTCTESVSKGKTSEESGNPLKGKIESLTFSKCTLGTTSCTATSVHLPYNAAVTHTEGTFNGIMKVTNGGTGAPGATVVCGSLINCTFTAEGIELDALGGNPGSIVANKETLGHEAGLICPTTATWTATYTVNTPNPVFVAHG